MKKAHLHIGSYKTGTTFIQQTLSKNRNILNELGYHYPGGYENHHFSFFATKADQEDWPRHFLFFDRKKLQNTLDYSFRSLGKGFQQDFDEQIISTEYLFITDKRYITNYLDYLENFFDEVIVYMFVRNPVEYFRSFQQEMIKARSYITSPQIFKYKFKEVIEVWKEFCKIEVLEYERGKDSCKTLCENMGVNFDKLEKPAKNSNTSLSIEQMALLEKIQHNLHRTQEDKFKSHLAVINQVDAPFISKSKLKADVQKLVYKNHHEDLVWLNDEYGINFLNEEWENTARNLLPTFKNDKARVRDVYEVENEATVEKYEALVVDSLLKHLMQNNQN